MENRRSLDLDRAAAPTVTALAPERPPANGSVTRRGTYTPLYRMRAGHLHLLAIMLVDAGHLAEVATPPGMPVLRVLGPNWAGLEVLATIGYGDVDWYRWRERDFIAPVAEPQVAAEEMLRSLSLLGTAG